VDGVCRGKMKGMVGRGGGGGGQRKWKALGLNCLDSQKRKAENSIFEFVFDA